MRQTIVSQDAHVKSAILSFVKFDWKRTAPLPVRRTGPLGSPGLGTLGTGLWPGVGCRR